MKTLSIEFSYCVDNVWFIAAIEGAKIGNLIVWRIRIARVIHDLVVPLGTEYVADNTDKSPTLSH